jgi:hypothetical protein
MQHFLYLRPLPHGQGSLRPGAAVMPVSGLARGALIVFNRQVQQLPSGVPFPLHKVEFGGHPQLRRPELHRARVDRFRRLPLPRQRALAGVLTRVLRACAQRVGVVREQPPPRTRSRTAAGSRRTRSPSGRGGFGGRAPWARRAKTQGSTG